ncbi:MAG: hypothetical protein F6K42_27435, partial [Leptolyngbya sp. SIO1D8]|nr:hypothetical protein [Leptolyngbya sp. SIO1D8]
MKKEKLDLDDIDFEVCDARVQMGDVEEIWTTLLQKCPHGFYLSWGWVSTWLETVPSDKKIFLITGFIENKPVMSFFLGEDKRIRNKFFLSHSLCLNTTGDPPLDIITVEYNTILIDPQLELNIDRIIGQIPEKGWNELKLPGLSDEFVSRMELLNDKWLNRFNILTEQHHESYFVDLQKIRDNGMDYDKL